MESRNEVKNVMHEVDWEICSIRGEIEHIDSILKVLLQYYFNYTPNSKGKFASTDEHMILADYRHFGNIVSCACDVVRGIDAKLGGIGELIDTELK